MTPSSPSLDVLLHAIGDPTRRRILQALKPKTSKNAKDAGMCASDIEARVRLSQPTISHHMAILEKAGFVETTKQSQWRWYRRNEGTIRELARRLRETL